MKKTVIAIIAVAVILAAISYFFVQKKGVDPTVLKVSGNIEITSVEVSFKIPGRISERLVDEGETLHAGQLVARLESKELHNEVTLHEASVQAVKARLSELLAGSRKEEIGQAEAALERVKAEADHLETDYQRVKALYEREVVSKRELDISKSSRESSRAMVREAQETLTLLQKGPRKERIDQARARLMESEAALEQARIRLGYSTLYTPMDGMVLAKHVESGEQVAPGTPVITVGDIVNPWVRAYISETDLGRIKVGQRAQISTDTYPDKRYEGTVSFIASESEFTPKNVQTNKERVKLVYRIKVVVNNPAMELKPGMPSDVEIITTQED